MDFLENLMDKHPLTKLEGMLLPATKYLDDVLTHGTSIKKEDFSTSTLSLLENIVRDEGVGPVDLKRDQRILDTYGNGFKEGLDHLTKPYGQLRNTLGQFNITQNDSDEYILTDTYDWSNNYKDMGYTGDTLNVLGKIAYEHGGTKEGQGTPYTINLGKLPKKGMLQPRNP